MSDGAAARPSPESEPRVALVHDWLVQWGGAERVLEVLAGLFPSAPIFTGVWAPEPRVAEAFAHRSVHASGLQRLPGVHRYYRALLPAMPAAFEALDLSAFDLVISSCHAFSKAVRTRKDACHVCYCHTPPRYLWDLYATYNPGWKGRLRAPVARRLRRRDVEASARVGHFVANSRTVQERIGRHYGREADVVYPPVDVARFTRAARDADPEDWFLAGGRMVPYKRLDVVVEAANRGGFPLKVFGDGPQRGALTRLAGPTVELLGDVPDETLAALMARCAAFLFAGEEDFGILPVEAQAAGRPVVAWARGGVTESVVPDETGVLLERASPDAFVEGAAAAARRPWDSDRIRANAARFTTARFQEGIARVLRARGFEVDHGSSGRPAPDDPPGNA